MVHVLGAMVIALVLGNAPEPSAYDIFNAARAQWQAETYPQHLSYVIETSVAGKNGPLVNDYEATCFCTKGDIRVDPISTEEAQHPTTPHGVNFRFNFTIGWGNGPSETTGKQLDPTSQPDPIGVPLLSPLYSFGLRQEPIQTAKNEADTSTLPTIITTTSSAKNPYDIALADVESLDGDEAYHLTLRAVTDAEKYRLRDLWIDTKTYDTLRAVVGENFTGRQQSHSPWTIDFAREDGFQYIVDETSGTSKILFKNVELTQRSALGPPIDDDLPDALREPN
jgi:hypothetical protein